MAVSADLMRAAVQDSPDLPTVAGRALERARVAWAVLREPADAELDVLVAPADEQAALSALRAEGFVRVPSWGRGTHRFLRGYDEARDEWWTVDLVSELAFGPMLDLHAPVVDDVLRRRQDGEQVGKHGPGLHHSDAFWVLLLHCLLDKQGRFGRHQPRVAQLAQRAAVEGPIAEHLVRVLGDPGCDELLRLTRREDWNGLREQVRSLRRAWTASRPGEVVPRRVLNTALQHSTKAMVAARRRGLSVVLLGPDGAGKSSAAAALVETFPGPTRRIYGGHYGRRLGVSERVPGLPLLARLGVQIGNEAVTVTHRLRGRLVVHDRHALDADVRTGEPRGRQASIRRWLLAHASLPPQLVVVLDAPGEVLHRRSGEHTVEALERQRRGYLDLAVRRRDSIVVDATQGRDAVRRDVTSAVWRRYAAAWDPRSTGTTGSTPRHGTSSSHEPSSSHETSSHETSNTDTPRPREAL